MFRLAAKSSIFFLLVTLVLMMSVGGIFSAQMMMEDGMHDCPFMGIAALCEMSPLQHLSEWQSMFATTFQQFSTFALLLLLALALTWRFADQFFLPKPTKIFVPRYRYRERVFDPLKLAFARGLIHPKVF
jgi:hypothetical protein